MPRLLIKWFIKNPENIADEKVRLAYGMLTAFTGIFCNVFLFALKLGLGLFMHSLSVVSDAFNNLSDCLSSLVTLFGYRLAARPADREHPFGHGRMEYIASLIVSVFILLCGFELLQTSVRGLLHPQEIRFSWPSAGIFAASILVKMWLSRMNAALGKKLNNTAMLAVAQDSRNDVFTTLGALTGLVFSRYSAFPFDATAGAVVSCFILGGGISLFRKIISRLLGNPASYALTNEIRKIILLYPEVAGVHDMIIHDYGPGKKFGSAHVEMDAAMNFMHAHTIIDEAEREIYEKTHVSMTLHPDPLDLRDPRVADYRRRVLGILHGISPLLTMHDFRAIFGLHHTNLIFDVLVPYDFALSGQELQKRIDERLAEEDPPVYTVITFDHAFTAADGKSDTEEEL